MPQDRCSSMGTLNALTDAMMGGFFSAMAQLG